MWFPAQNQISVTILGRHYYRKASDSRSSPHQLSWLLEQNLNRAKIYRWPVAASKWSSRILRHPITKYTGEITRQSNNSGVQWKKKARRKCSVDNLISMDYIQYDNLQSWIEFNVHVILQQYRHNFDSTLVEHNHDQRECYQSRSMRNLETKGKNLVAGNAMQGCSIHTKLWCRLAKINYIHSFTSTHFSSTIVCLNLVIIKCEDILSSKFKASRTVNNSRQDLFITEGLCDYQEYSVIQKNMLT